MADTRDGPGRLPESEGQILQERRPKASSKRAFLPMLSISARAMFPVYGVSGRGNNVLKLADGTRRSTYGNLVSAINSELDVVVILWTIPLVHCSAFRLSTPSHGETERQQGLLLRRLHKLIGLLVNCGIGAQTTLRTVLQSDSGCHWIVLNCSQIDWRTIQHEIPFPAATNRSWQPGKCCVHADTFSSDAFESILTRPNFAECRNSDSGRC